MNYHVKTTDYKLRSAMVVFHIPIPDEDNLAGVNLRDALYQRLGNSAIVSKIPTLEVEDEIEFGEIQNCVKYEYEKKVIFSSADIAPGIKQTEIDIEFTTSVVEVVSRIRNELKYWGKKRNVT